MEIRVGPVKSANAGTSEEWVDYIVKYSYYCLPFSAFKWIVERDGDKEGFTIRCKVIIHSIADIEVFLADGLSSERQNNL